MFNGEQPPQESRSTVRATQNDYAVFRGLRIDHLGWVVEDLDATVAALAEGYGFGVYAEARGNGARSAAVGRDRIRLVLTESFVDTHPAATYVRAHGGGISDIALRVEDAAAAFTVAVRRGASPVAPPCERDGVVTSAIRGFGDVVHTFVQRADTADDRQLPGLSPVGPHKAPMDFGLRDVDHVAVCLPAGALESTVEFYRQALDFEMIFEEKILVGAQAMNSQVVQSASGAVTLTLLEPDVSKPPGQIDEFLDRNGGPGVQHVAFASTDIISSVRAMRSSGVEFLAVPGTYYDALRARVPVTRHAGADLRDLAVLVDEDHGGQLFQVFTRSTHDRNTLFFEVIERAGAATFGTNNIKALYTAVEQARTGAAHAH